MTDPDLVRAIRSRQVVLFVGSGVSAGLGIPTWSGLVGQIGHELGFESDVFASLGANYLTVAEYYRLQKGGIGKLRSWIDKKWSVEDERLLDSSVHNLLVDIDFPIIYTTNYDPFLEDIYRLRKKKHTKIVNIRDFKIGLKGTPIVKLHGDFSSDESLVIAESDYFERLDFNSPLDIRLRSDVLGKTILFVGYSLSDINVRLMLYKMWSMWRNSGFGDEQPKSFIFLSKPDPIQEAVLANWGVHTITLDVDDPNTALASFLAALKADVEST